MSAPFLAKMPRPALFALTGALAGLLVALTAGELVWYLLRPTPTPEQHTEPPVQPPAPPLSPPPGPQLAVTAAPITVYPGGKNTFGVRIARERFEGPVTVRFETPTGLSAAEVLIPATDSAAKAEVVAPTDAKPGTFTLTATASAVVEERPVSATAPVQVTVSELPPPPARLAVSTSPRVGAYQKGKNTFAVRVARADFDDPITVTFDDLPDGVKIVAVTVPAGKTEATAELTADAGAKVGETKVKATARAAPKGVATSAATEVVAEVLDPNRAPLDVVLVLDCTGSMKRSVDGLCRNFPTLVAELNKARFDVRFGVVGFRDTTLAQPLELPRINGERMSTDVNRFVAVVRGLRLGGGGGDGESSLDGVAEAADFPLRQSAARVILLVTDGPPKRVDARMRSMDMAVKYLTAKRINQLHIVTPPQHYKALEPLWEGARGKYFDLKGATDGNEFDKLMTELSKAIAEAVASVPVPKPEPPPTAPVAVLPELPPVKPPDPPASREPDEPRIVPPAVPPAPAPQPQSEPTEKPQTVPPAEGTPLAVGAWAAAVACCTCLALVLSQWTFLPGELPASGVAGVGYSAGLLVGLVAGALGYLALDAVGIALLTRLGSAYLFGGGVGLIVPLAEQWFRTDVPAPAPLPLPSPLPPLPPPASTVPPPVPARAPVPELDLPPVEAYPTSPKAPPARDPLPELDLPPVEAHPSAPPARPAPARAPLLDLDLPPVEAYSTAPVKPPPPPPAKSPPPAAPAHKPNITGAPKPGDGCPKCGRKIPGAVGTRYCMLCDNTF